MAKKHKPTAHKIKKKEPSERKTEKGVIVLKKSTLRNAALVLAAIVVLAVIIYASGKIERPDNTPAGDKAKLEFYVMSQCPYGTQVEDAIQPVLAKMGDAVDFQLNFILYPRSSYAGSEAQYCVEELCSMHGTPEVWGDVVQLCAVKYNPESYIDLIVCMNENAAQIPDNWEACAQKLDMEVEKIRACYERDEGLDLLRESAARAQARGAQGSPTIYLDDQAYSGARDSTSFQRAICQNVEHEECSKIPACGTDADCEPKEGKIPKCENPNTEDAECTYVDAVKVEFVVLNDKDCASCDPTRIAGITKQLFPGAVQRNVDVNSAEGKKLVEELNIVYIPTYLLGENVVDTNSWKTNAGLAGSFEKRGEWYKIKDSASGATHYVSEELQAEMLAEMGVVVGDNKPQMDIFVMAYCPYGNQAEEVIEPVFQLLKDKADFNVWYVIYENYQGGGPNYCLDDESMYCSMHGVQELNQGIREHCVEKYIGSSEMFEFMLAMNSECSYQNADTCWEAVAEGLGLDVDVIKQCEADEGLELTQEDKRMTELYGVSGSPTVFIDGEKYAGSRTAEGFQAALCAAFEDAPSECDETIDGGTQTTVAQGQC